MNYIAEYCVDTEGIYSQKGWHPPMDLLWFPVAHTAWQQGGG